MGNKTYVNPKKVSDEYRNMHHTYWLFCPRCFHINSVKPFLIGDELYMSLYCKCMSDERQFMPFEELLKLIKEKKAIGNFCKKHKNTPGFLYCIYCEKWLCEYCFLSHKENYPLHLLNHIPVKLKEYCAKHPKDLAVGYCKSCNFNICENCYKDKQKIRCDIFLFGNPDYKDLSEKNWEDFLEKQYQHSKKNLELKDEMINNIKNDPNLNEEEKKLLKQNVIISYSKNKKINDKLVEYILLLFSNFDFAFGFSKIQNYNVCQNIINLKFNDVNYIEENLSIKENIAKLMQYYDDNHLVRMNHLVCVKNIFTERQNVTNQIAKIVQLDDNTAATLISKGIVIVWNFMTYDELYRIKKVTINEKIENENNNIDNNNINNNNINPNIINNNNNINDNINNFLLDEDDINNNNNINNNNILINNNIIQQQIAIFNQIQGNLHHNDIRKVNILKVYHVKKVSNINLNDINNDLIYQDDLYRINNERKNEEDEDNEGLDLNFNFTSIAFVKKYNILALIIENYNEIYLFNVKTQKALPEKLIAHKKEVLEIIALKNSNLASYGKDQTLRIWNMKHFQNVTTINVEMKKYYIYFTQLYYGNLIFASDKFTIKRIKLPEYEFLPNITGASHPINYFEMPDRRLLIASEDYYLRIYEPPDYTKFIVFSNSRQKIYSFILLDLNRLLIGIEEKGQHSLNILSWRDKGHKITRNFLGELGFRSPIGSIIKTKNKRVITISWDNLIKVFIARN